MAKNTRQVLTDKSEIEAWLEAAEIYDYDIKLKSEVVISEGMKLLKNKSPWIIDVYSDLVLSDQGDYLPVDFGKVTGDVNLSHMELKSLAGSPYQVGGDFLCNSNKLKTLEFGPSFVRGQYNCSQNELKSLLGAPDITHGRFNCSYNNLTSLQHCPKMNYDFYCSFNPLKTLEFCPVTVVGNFECKITNELSLAGFTTDIKSNFVFYPKNITELKSEYARPEVDPNVALFLHEPAKIQKIVAVLAEKAALEKITQQSHTNDISSSFEDSSTQQDSKRFKI